MRILAYCTAALLLLSACGKSGGLKFEDAVTALPAFSDPLQITIALDPNDAALGGSCLAARLVKNGSMSLKPSVAGPPYWTVDLKTGGGNGNEIYIPVGSRKVRSISERRAWKEGAISYQAASVTYDVVNEGPLAPAGEAFGPFGIRLVFENDPALGQWVLSPQSRGLSTEIEQAAIETNIASNCDLNVLIAASTEAKRLAFDELEKVLADSRGIKRTSTPNIIESASIGRQLYLGTEHVNALVGLPITAVVPKARQLCDGLQAGGHSDWRLGSFADMRSVTNNQVHDTIRLPLDLPDRRIWGTFLGSFSGREQVYMPVSDAPSQNWGPFAGLAVGSGTRFSENDLVMGYHLQSAHFRLFCVRNV